MKPIVGMLVVVAAMFAQPVLAEDGAWSDPAFVFLKPETSSFWRTATNSVVTLPVKYPEGATSADLTVNGVGYSRMYADIPEGDFDLELPVADSPENENVYELALSFNDGTVRTAKLGLIQGLMTDGNGATRCIAPKDGARWSKTRSRAVMPIPYGMKSFSVVVNGKEVDDGFGLDGAQGWYALSGLKTGDTIDLSLSKEGETVNASLICRNPNFTVVIK